MPDKLIYSENDRSSLIAGTFRSHWVRGKLCGLHDSESIRQNKKKFAGEAEKLLIIISGSDKTFRLRKQRIWTDRKYQEKVIFSFFAGDEKGIKKVLRKVKIYRLPCTCISPSPIEQPCNSPNCIHAPMQGGRNE
tara:strand:+ start:37095 stop:37499 length:405 start_codon:yes stop_codon:yes gene_type:complete